MKRISYFALTVMLGASAMLLSCNNSRSAKDNLCPPEFPYQSYLDSIGDGDVFPVIGDDGDGFNAISHNIRYPEMPESLRMSQFADSLLQYYDIALAYNTMAYDTGTAIRYMSESGSGLEYADALDSINLDPIKSLEIKKQLREITGNAARWIREGVDPNSQEDEAIDRFYDAFNPFVASLLDNRFSEDEFDPHDVISDYDGIHTRALTDTLSLRQDLLKRVLSEKDFAKKCVLAREYAYSNYIHPRRDDKEVVAVIDNILRADEYSPLLRDLWRMWRMMLQKNIFGSMSNDGAMYNLFYNDMRNRVALTYIAHLKDNTDDRIALKEFVRLANDYNIVRNSEFVLGNNSNLEEMDLFYSVFESNKSDND